MKNWYLCPLFFSISSLLIGCSGSDSSGTQTTHTHLEVVKSAMQNYATTAQIIQSVNDNETGEQAIPKIKEHTQDLFQLIQKLTKLGPASGDEKARIRRLSSDMSREGGSVREAITELLAKIDSGKFSDDLGPRLRTTSKEYYDAMKLFGIHGDKLLE